MGDSMSYVQSLRIHPIKACGIVKLEEAMVTRRGLMSGLIGDRRWALIDDENRVITQRRDGHSGERGHPELTLVKVSLAPDTRRATHILVQAKNYGAMFLSPQQDISEETVIITLHGKTSPAQLIKNGANSWFSGLLGRKVRLVLQTDDNVRYCDKNFWVDSDGNRNSLADGYPVTVAHLSSLRGLNAKSSVPLDPDNFRSNIVLDGVEGDHVENSWRTIEIGEAAIELVKPCTRCEVTTIDLTTGRLPDIPFNRAEPLVTLEKQWKVRFKVGDTVVAGSVYSENGIPTREGIIKIGDAVTVTAGKPEPKWLRPSP